MVRPGDDDYIDARLNDIEELPMSGIKVYVFLLFGITMILYLFGYTSPFVHMISGVGVNVTYDAATASSHVATDTNYVNTLQNSLASVFMNPIFLGLVGVSAVAAYITGGGGGNSIYFLAPLFIITMLMANYFVLPVDFINQANMDPLIAIFVLGFLNILLALSIVEFVRGT
jgi:hypothetical protein